MSTIISRPATPAAGRRIVADHYRAKAAAQRDAVRRAVTAADQWKELRKVRSLLEKAAARLGAPLTSLRWKDGGIYIGDARVPDAVLA